MTKTRFYGVALAALFLIASVAAQAGETILPFHSTLQVVETPDDPAWVAACQEKGYDSGFKALRTGYVNYVGRVTSVEQGCLDFKQYPLVRSYTQLVVTDANGDTLDSFNQCVFDFSQDQSPATGTFVITGGTGRFADARGSGTLGNTMGDANAGFIIYQDGSIRLRLRR